MGKQTAKQELRVDDPAGRYAAERDADLFEARLQEDFARRDAIVGVVLKGVAFAAVAVVAVMVILGLVQAALPGRMALVGFMPILPMMLWLKRAEETDPDRVHGARQEDEAAKRARARRRAHHRLRRRALERTPADMRTDFLVTTRYRIDGTGSGVLFVGPTSVVRFEESMSEKRKARLLDELAAAKDAEEAEATALAAARRRDAGDVLSLERRAARLRFDGDLLVMANGEDEEHVELPEEDREHFRRALRVASHPYRGS